MKSFLPYLILCFSTLISAQQFSAKIIDAKTSEPVPFATVQINDNTGVITNEEGIFNINLENNDKLFISCLGYQQLEQDVSEIEQNNFTIKLKEALNELDAVYLSNSTPSVDSIISRVVKRIPQNYTFNNLKHSVFYRNNSRFKFDQLQFDIDKASGIKRKKLANANKSLDSLAKVIKNSNSVFYTDVLGELYVKDKDTSKLQIAKATMLLDKDNSFSIESVQEKAQSLIFKYLDKNKSYKVSSGFFKVEDSLSFEDLEEPEENKNELYSSGIRSDLEYLLKRTDPNSKFFTQLLSTKYYNYSLKDVTYFNDQLIYILTFTPRKGKAKFSGTMYVNEEDYAITKIEYQFADGKHGQKVNLRLLLGIKFIDNLKKGTIIFNKHNEFYTPKYLSFESGQYVYLHRPLKLKENSPEKNKVKFDALVEGSSNNKIEILLDLPKSINTSDFDTANEPKTVEYIELKKYDPLIWKQYNVLEPLNEMKNFNVE